MPRTEFEKYIGKIVFGCVCFTMYTLNIQSIYMNRKSESQYFWRTLSRSMNHDFHQQQIDMFSGQTSVLGYAIKQNTWKSIWLNLGDLILRLRLGAQNFACFSSRSHSISLDVDDEISFKFYFKFPNGTIFVKSFLFW